MIKTVNNATPSEHAQAMGLDPDFLPPFALRENEQSIPVIVERENHKLTSRYEAEFLVSVGVISEDVDIKLLEIINKFIVINVRQLLSVATLDGIEIKREQVMSSIKKLLKYRFIQAVRFENGVNTKSKSGYVIALECNGSLLLKARHRDDSVQVKYISYFKSIDIYKLKKILSANQLIIDMFYKNGAEISGFSKCIILRDIYDIEKRHVIRPECRFTYNGTDCFVETVRRNSAWQEKLTDKLGYYYELFNLPEGRLSVKTENPVLILISEDENHCEEVMRIAAKAKHKGILVTSDKFTYTLTPDNAFFKPAIQSKENLFSKLKSLLKAS